MLAAVNIDLDGLDCYHAIHGLDPPGREVVYRLALDRFLELTDELGLRATLFVITRYLDEPDGHEAAERLERAAAEGHELASHTHSHPYDLGQQSSRDVGHELDEAADRLEGVGGRRPVGFRTPGYNVSETILDELEARGYLYDSSVFPCPPYYLAKAAVMGVMRVTGRPSGSALTDPKALLAPLQPYRPRRGRFYRPAGSGSRARPLWELPMAVVPGLRIGVIGTSLALFGSRSFGLVYPLLRRTQPVLNLEFHGIDFLGPGDPGVTGALLDKQPDLRIPFGDKLRTYRDVLSRIGRDYRYATLEHIVGELTVA